MKSLGIFTGTELKCWSLTRLQQRFGKTGHYYYNIARGIDERPVYTQRVRKSLSTETTFAVDISDRDEMMEHLGRLAGEVVASLEARDLDARTLCIKVKYADFELVTRARTLESTVCKEPGLDVHLRDLLDKTEAGAREVRLLGVGAARLFNSLELQDRTQLVLI